jgi:transposase
LLSALETITARIREYDVQIEKLAEESYPEVALLKQVKGVGTLIALTYVLTLEDPKRFRKSRDAGCYVGLQPGRGTPGRANLNCISPGREIPICAWCWYKGHNTSWAPSERTPICVDGD